MRGFWNIDTPLSVLLSPLLVGQLLWVRRHAIQMPEPRGPRRGAIGAGPKRSLLILGDSSAVGVGVDTQAQALGPQLAAHLGDHFHLRWTLCGKNGATSADQHELLAGVVGQRFDLAYVILGVNDAKNLRPVWAWQRDLVALIDILRRNHKVQEIVFSGLPRVEDFPLLPRPLRSILAMRTRRFDAKLREVAQRQGCHVAPLAQVKLDRAGMAPDGFHPGAPIYATWADLAAQFLRPILAALNSG